MVVLFRILIILSFILSLASFPLFAQNKQVMLWKVYDHIFDFTTNPMSVRTLPYSSDNCSWGGWYVDSNGEVILDSRLDGLYNKDGKKIIEGYYDFWLFVPSPNNERYVYCLSEFGIYRVDTQESIVTDIFPTPFGIQSSIAVHSLDCDNIWLIDYSENNNLVVYSIDNEVITQSKTIKLNPNDYKATTTNTEFGWNINLSMDCNNYTFSSRNNTTTYYGTFDRADASFSRKSSYTFSGYGYDYISNSLISPDKTRIYYLLFRYKEWAVNLVEVRIVDGLPDYSTLRHFYTIENERNDVGLFYGLDGKVYFMGYHTGIYGTIEIIDDKAVYKDLVTFPTNWVQSHFSMPSWYLPYPCGNNPCEDMNPPIIRWK